MVSFSKHLVIIYSTGDVSNVVLKSAQKRKQKPQNNSLKSLNRYTVIDTTTRILNIPVKKKK